VHFTSSFEEYFFLGNISIFCASSGSRSEFFPNRIFPFLVESPSATIVSQIEKHLNYLCFSLLIKFMISFEIIITLIFELMTFILSVFISSKLIKNNNNNFIQNKFLAAGCLFCGLYTIFTFLYTIIATEFAIELFLTLGIISIIFAVLLLFFTLKVILKSSKWLETPEKWLWIIIAGIIIGLTFHPEYIIVTDVELSLTEFHPIFYNIYAIFVLFMLGYSAFITYSTGIVKADEKELKTKMKKFLAGLIIFISSLLVDVIGNLVEEGEVFFDMGLFGLISLAMVTLASAILPKK
jgi:hypothetical protein